MSIHRIIGVKMNNTVKPTLLKVFVSSTKEDLENERIEARAAILDLYSFHELPFKPVMFEYEFGSHSSSPRQTSLEYVRDSNIFLGIYAERYGSCLPKEKVSITQREYIEAKKFARYILIYVKEIEENKRDEKLRDFLKKIGDIDNGVTFSKFKNQYELKEKIKDDLIKYYQTFGLKKVFPIQFNSNPPGAMLFIDGKYVGDTD